MRCAACDAILQPEEIIWYDDDTHRHEELCTKCLIEAGLYSEEVVLDIDEDTEEDNNIGGD